MDSNTLNSLFKGYTADFIYIDDKCVYNASCLSSNKYGCIDFSQGQYIFSNEIRENFSNLLNGMDVVLQPTSTLTIFLYKTKGL